MSIIAIIVAVFYTISVVMFTISAFLVSNFTGFLVLGIAFLIPSLVLYIEANKGGAS